MFKSCENMTMTMSAAILCSAVYISDDMNKANTCG